MSVTAAPPVDSPADAQAAELRLRQKNALQSLSVGQFLNSCTWTVVSSAQTALGLHLAPSRGQLLTTMSLIASISNLGQFLILPIMGALSDKFGRKPIMVARSLSSAVFPTMVAFFPSYPLFIAHRLVALLTWHLTETAQQASLADVFEGRELAVGMAQCRSQMGMAMLVGPIVGGWLAERSLRIPYAISGAFGAINTLRYILVFRETLGAREEISIAGGTVAERQAAADAVAEAKAKVTINWGLAANPLGFLNLFRHGRVLGWLAVVSTLSELCDGTVEIDRHYGMQVAGMSLTEDGTYNSLRGAANVLGGRLVGPVISVFSNRAYTALGSTLICLHYVMKAGFRTPTMYMANLLPYILGAGTYRSAAVNAQLVKSARDAGMKEGETAACQANLRALFSMFTPWVYSSLYGRFMHTESFPGAGAPYLLCLAFMITAQLCFMTQLSANDMDDSANGLIFRGKATASPSASAATAVAADKTAKDKPEPH